MKWFSRRKVLDPLEGYNRWAETYVNESNPIKNLSDELIRKWIGDISEKSVLDVGCGTGKTCGLALEKGASKILGVDFSPIMIKEAQKNHSQIEFACLDITKDKIAGRFDFVVCALVLGHLRDLNFVLSNLFNSVNDDGTVLITDFHPFLTLKNGRRTFTEEKSGRTYEIEHHLHLFEEYFSLFEKANFYVEELVEPVWNGMPVIFGMKLRRIKI